MRTIEGEVESGNMRAQRTRAPRVSPELAELMHMLDSLETHFTTRSDDSDR